MARSDAEMKAVLQHVRAKLDRAQSIEQKRNYPNVEMALILGYTQGVVDLLLAYLVVNDDAETDEPAPEDVDECDDDEPPQDPS